MAQRPEDRLRKGIDRFRQIRETAAEVAERVAREREERERVERQSPVERPR